jgi:hydrogenase maturation protease
MMTAFILQGVGNYLRGDEGIGVHVAARLPQETLPASVGIVDGGTGGFHL